DGNIIDRPLALAYERERANHRAHLRMQERARRSHDLNVVRAPMHVELIERLHRRFRLTFDIAEGGEIMPADETLRRRLHGRDIEPLGDAPGKAAFEGEIGAAVDDAIEIMAPDGGEAGIARIVHPFSCDHG